MANIVEWLPLCLGFIGVLGALGWLYWRGIRRARLMWSLVGLSALWAAGMLLAAFRWWPPALLTLSLAFAVSVVLLVYLAWREGSQCAEIARLRRLAAGASRAPASSRSGCASSAAWKDK